MEKLYYSISDVSKIVDEEQHILRYWEKEFSEINPRKNRAGNRVYSLRDLAVLKAVKHLLRNEKISLKGAKEKIKEIDFNKSDTDGNNLNININQNENADSKNHINSSQDNRKFSNDELIELRKVLTDIRDYLVS